MGNESSAPSQAESATDQKERSLLTERWFKPFEVEVGGLSRDQLLARLSSHGVSLNAHAQTLIAHPVFDERAGEPILVVERSVAELGLGDGATLSEIYSAAEGKGLGLCPPRDGTLPAVGPVCAG